MNAAPTPTNVVRGDARVGISRQSANPWRLSNRSAWGQTRRFDLLSVTSDVHSTSDVSGPGRHFAVGPKAEIAGLIRPPRERGRGSMAVLRLITSSTLGGCSTGRSAGSAPFGVRSTQVTASRITSACPDPEAMRPPASASSLEAVDCRQLVKVLQGRKFFFLVAKRILIN